MKSRATVALTMIALVAIAYQIIQAPGNDVPSPLSGQENDIANFNPRDDSGNPDTPPQPFEGAIASHQRVPAPTAVAPPVATTAGDYVPTPREARSLRTFRNYCRELGIPIAGAPRSMEQWGEFRAVMAQFQQPLRRLIHDRAQAASRIALDRLHGGQLERIASGNDRAAKRAMRQAMQPQHERQVISIVSSAGDTYVSRIDPGQDPGIDALSSEIMATKALLHEAAHHFIR